MKLFPDSAWTLDLLDELRARPLLVYGPGTAARAVIYHYRAYGCEPAAILCEDEVRAGQLQHGVPVLHVREAALRFPGARVHVAAGDPARVRDRLVQAGAWGPEDLVEPPQGPETEYHRVLLDLRLAVPRERLARLRAAGGTLAILGAGDRARAAQAAFRDLGLPASCFGDPEALPGGDGCYVFIALDGAGPLDLLALEARLTARLPEANILNPLDAGRCGSCVRLESGLDFDPEGIRFCCDSSVEVLPPYAQRFASRGFDLASVDRRRRELMAENQQPDGYCVRCRKFRRDHWMSDGRIDYISMNPFFRCQLACVYCKDWHIACEQPEVTQYDILPVLEELHAHGRLAPHVGVWIAGGEPTIYREFERILDFFATHYPRSTVEVGTNAVKYSPALARAMERGMARAVVSVDCGTPESYAAIKGRPFFEAVRRNLARYGQATSANRLKYILLDNNVDDANLDGFIALCEASNIHGILISRDYARSREPFVEREVAAMRRLLTWAARRGVSTDEIAPLFLDLPENRRTYDRLVAEARSAT